MFLKLSFCIQTGKSDIPSPDDDEKAGGDSADTETDNEGRRLDQSSGQGIRQNDISDQVSGKSAHNFSDEPSRSPEIVNSYIQTSAADEFTVKQLADLLIITHVQSRTRTKLRCTGTYAYDDNLLVCNGECFELKFENGRIILDSIPEYDKADKDSPGQTSVDVRDEQARHPPSSLASPPTSTITTGCNGFHFF